MQTIKRFLAGLLLAGTFTLFLTTLPEARAQRYQTNDMTLAINSVTASTASNSTTIAASGGFAPSFYKLANPDGPFDVFVDFTCNTQVFWGATFVFGGSVNGTTANTMGGASIATAQSYRQLFTLICPTNTTSVSNYTAVFRSTDTNLWSQVPRYGPYLVFHGATNIAPTTLTINRITIGQVQ